MPICVNCKVIIEDDVKGSLKYPVCPKCYKEKFNNNVDKYLKALKEHLK